MQNRVETIRAIKVMEAARKVGGDAGRTMMQEYLATPAPALAGIIKDELATNPIFGGTPAPATESKCPCQNECLHECKRSHPDDEYGRAAPHGEGCRCRCPCWNVCTCGAEYSNDVDQLNALKTFMAAPNSANKWEIKMVERQVRKFQKRVDRQ